MLNKKKVNFMKNNTKSKTVRISDESLRAVLEVVHKTKRNFTCATEYLFIYGYVAFLREQEILNNNIQNTIDNYIAKNKMEG